MKKTPAVHECGTHTWCSPDNWGSLWVLCWCWLWTPSHPAWQSFPGQHWFKKILIHNISHEEHKVIIGEREKLDQWYTNSNQWYVCTISHIKINWHTCDMLLVTHGIHFWVTQLVSLTLVKCLNFCSHLPFSKSYTLKWTKSSYIQQVWTGKQKQQQKQQQRI